RARNLVAESPAVNQHDTEKKQRSGAGNRQNGAKVFGRIEGLTAPPFPSEHRKGSYIDWQGHCAEAHQFGRAASPPMLQPQTQVYRLIECAAEFMPGPEAPDRPQGSPK